MSFLQPLEAKSLFKLNFHKNSDGMLRKIQFRVSWVTVMIGKYHCPVTYKVFNENTHIVAVKTTGNVYCMEVSSQGVAPSHVTVWGCVGHRQWRD